VITSAEIVTSRFDFEDVADKAGVRFVLANNPTPEKRMIETMPGGIAVFDFNGDGRPDIFFTNGAEVPSLKKTSPAFWNRLYRNDGNFHFTDVTEQAGVVGLGYSMGVAAGDYDNDGHPDLFVAGVNRNQLLHNRGDGTFDDVTEKAGIKSGDWAVAAGWFDYDRDGLLDLLVVHYSGTPLQDRYCGNRDKDIRIYCNPKYFEPLASTLYHNRGHGVFEDVSKASGIAKYAGRGMSVAFADYDNDGYPDIFITNDNMPNFLFHNLRNGTFEEVGLAAGVALSDRGQPVSSMGTDFRDFDNDGRPDIIFSALVGETFPLFRGIDNQTFSDVSYPSRMGPLSIFHSGWGIGLVDLNNDGWKDIFTANSHVNDRIEEFESHAYKEPNSVFANVAGKFVEATPASLQGSVKAHRGCAFADFDGDGRMDVVVSALGEQAEVWRNTTPGAQNWIAFRLQGTGANRDGIGARIRIGNQWNEMTSAVSYASSSLIAVPFGIGKTVRVDDAEIRWPDGRVQHLRNVAANQIVDVKEPLR
jgi:enediyne biosynthesis protein E4